MKTEKRFSFAAQGVSEDDVTVVSFTGAEGLSRPYEFVITLASKRDDLNLEHMGEGLATLSVLRKEGDLPFHGIVTRFEQLSAAKHLVFYRAVLAPRLWALTLTCSNRVFLDQSAPEFLKKVLEDSGILTSRDYEFRLSASYPAREFVCQRNESDFHFLSRWLEREGMYFYFDQQSGADKLIITDSKISHLQLSGQPKLEFRQVQGMNLAGKEEFVHSFVREENVVSQSVKVKDYNYRLPSLDIQGAAQVQEGDMGEVYTYGDNVKSSNEAGRQATLMAEEATSRSKRYKGRSTSPFVRSGHTFELEKHFRSDANQEYLALNVQHEGKQTGYLITVFGRAPSGEDAMNYYRNSFTAMPSELQYRHPREASKPRFYGLVSATVDAAGGGEYASLDDKGRYKVRLPFDLSGKPDGSASCWVRMGQPYGGDGHGMHLPLLKGSEVLMAFMDGDVDRPVIAHAVPNFEQLSVVTNQNPHANIIRTAGQNQILMEDKKGSESISLHCGAKNTGIVIGAPEEGDKGGIVFSTEGDWCSFSAGTSTEGTIGSKNELTGGITNDIFVGLKNELVAALSYSATLATRVEYVKGPGISLGEDSSDLKEEIDTTGMKSLTLSGGVAASVGNLVTSAHRSLAVGMLGSAIAGISMVGATAPFGDGHLNKEGANWKPAFAGGVIGVLAGGVMAACSAGKVKSLVKKFESASEKKKTGQIVLDKKGVHTTVNCDVSGAATLLSEVVSKPGCGDDEKSSLEIAAMGQSITLANMKTATLIMEDGDAISLKNDVAGEETELSLKDAAAALAKKNKGRLKVDNNGVTMEGLQPGTPGKVQALSDKAMMSCGQNSLSINASVIELSFAGFTFRAGPVNVNPAGVIMLG